MGSEMCIRDRLKLICKYGDIIAESALNILVKVIGCVLCVAGLVAGGALLVSA